MGDVTIGDQSLQSRQGTVGRVGDLADHREELDVLVGNPVRQGGELIVEIRDLPLPRGRTQVGCYPPRRSWPRQQHVPPSGRRALVGHRENALPQHPVGGDAGDPFLSRPFGEPYALQLPSSQGLMFVRHLS